MPLIYELLKTLHRDELEKVSSLQLQGREREVLEFMLNTKRKVFPASTLCNQLKIQPSHFDKIKSKLLKKAIEKLGGNSIYEQVEFLDKKNGQWNLTKHLLRSHEHKYIDKNGSPAENLFFYKFCFDWYLSIPFSHQEDGDIKRYTENMFRYCPAKEQDALSLWMRMMFFRRDLKLHTSKANIKLEAYKNRFTVELDNIIAQADFLQDPQMLYKSRVLGILLHTFIEDYKKCKVYYRECKKVIKDFASYFSKNDVLICELYYAQTLYHSNHFAESHALYTKVFAQFEDKRPLPWFMYYAEYMHVCMLTGNMEKAHTICYDFFGQFSDDINGSMYISSTLQMIKYFLFAKDTDRAFKFIHRVERHISKTTLLQFQLAIRELSVAANYVAGNYKNTIDLAEKNMKFLRFKKLHLHVPEYTFHSRLAKVICNAKKKDKPLSPKDLEMLDFMQQGTMALYGYLLKRFYTEQH